MSMTRVLTAMSDRLLTAVVPKAAASAACNYCGYNDYKCGGGSGFIRTCCLDFYCHLYNCTPWKKVGAC
jgi:hypothetical protein